jgi:predicted DNA-binding transcriptional regulator AlpA
MNNPAEAQQANPTPAMPIEILTPEQLALRLQVKRSWVYEQTRYRADIRNADPLPYLKLGLYLRFDWKDVLTWLERQKRQKPEPKRR